MKRWARGSLLYAVLVVLVLQLAVLALLYWNLTSRGTSQAAELEDDLVHVAVASLRKRTHRTMRLASESEGEEVRVAGLAMSSQRGAVQEAKLGGLKTIQKPEAVVQQVDQVSNDTMAWGNKIPYIATKMRGTLREKAAKSNLMNRTLISGERWKRVKPPSLLLDSEDEGERLALEAEQEKREIWKRELRRRAQLSEQAGKDSAVLREGRDVESNELGGVSNREKMEVLKLSKQFKKRTGQGGAEKDVKNKRIRNSIHLEKKDSVEVSQGKENGGQEMLTKDGEKIDIRSAQKEILHQQAMERERVQKLNRLWKERKEDLIGNKQSDPAPTLPEEDYFAEVCEAASGPLVECYETPLRNLSQSESRGDDIMFTVRTTAKYHNTRLPVLFETWFSEVEPSNVFIVTDGEDEDLLWKTNTLGIHYINVRAGESHNRTDLCCKAGVELELLHHSDNSKFNWVCHVDDDMYINLPPLVKALSHFYPEKERVYFGRSGSPREEPRQVKQESLLGTAGQRYHFAVGGMYCLSRAMLEAATPYLVGCKAFKESCLKAQEPEDVTVGLVTGVVLHEKLHWTEMIYSHGLDLLSSTPTAYLREQVAFSYGFGADGAWNIIPNVVYVPGALFNIDEDITQFRSLHCYFYPKVQWCVDKKRQVIEERKRARSEEEDRWGCECCWKKLICCNVYKENYMRFMQAKMAAHKEESS